ncbi:hypothetical protein GOBAR_DD27385 [Gossypium barbadense]|nr:hypothetical protein GOBAR_DD27385 [Gossypium barbadense]
MSLEAYASAKRDEIHTDVLLQARQACYKARDAFYSCLEKHSDKKPTEIGSVGLLYPTECKPSREDYVKNCRVSWYCKTKRTQRLLDDKETRRGPLSLPQPYTFRPPTSA